MKVEIRLKKSQDTRKFWKCFAAGLAPWSSLISKYRVYALVNAETFENPIFSWNVWALSLKFFGILWKTPNKTKAMSHMTLMCKNAALSGLE